MSYFFRKLLGSLLESDKHFICNYPKGADYSIVEEELEKWKNDSSEFEYELVETQYNMIHN